MGEAVSEYLEMMRTGELERLYVVRLVLGWSVPLDLLVYGVGVV